MGLGLSSNLDASASPHPYRLLEEEPGLFDYVEYSAPLSLDEASHHASLFPTLWARRAEVPVLFHPVHLNLYGPALESTAALAHLDAHARAVGSAWVGNDVGWWHADGEPFPGYLYIAPPFTRAGIADAAEHALHVRSHLSVPLVLENPAVIAVRGEWHVLDFMAELHARTGCPLLLDLGHLFSHQLARGLPLTAGLDGFPMDRVVEIHLAGGVVSRRGERRYYVDDHTQPVREELFELLAEVAPRCTHLRAVTLEADGHPPEVAALLLRRLRVLVPPTEGSRRGGAHSGSARPPAPRGNRPFTAATDPIALLDESYGLRPASEDATGVQAEVDFRMAVLAQAIDRRFPISRLLLAGTREGLESFMRSEFFRACFVQSHRTVLKAFQQWAIARARELREPSLDAVLALESLETQRRPWPAAPFDLTEARFAARALKRHLADRALATGAVELEALDQLWQVVRRAERRK
jgi:uncharacterized protein